MGLERIVNCGGREKKERSAENREWISEERSGKEV